MFKCISSSFLFPPPFHIFLPCHYSSFSVFIHDYDSFSAEQDTFADIFCKYHMKMVMFMQRRKITLEN